MYVEAPSMVWGVPGCQKVIINRSPEAPLAFVDLLYALDICCFLSLR